MKLHAAATAIAVVALAGAAQANLLTNPGLESGDLTGWTTFGAGNWRASSWAGDQYSGTYGLVDDVVEGGDEWRGAYQLIPVTGGLSYDYTAYLKGASIDTSESWLELQWIDSAGNQVSQWQSSHLTASADWSQYGSAGIVAPAGAVTASVRAVVHMIGTPNDPDYMMFDDLSFDQTIPEPTTLGLAGLAVAWMTALRRRHNRT